MLYEAVQRFTSPPEVPGLPVLAVAAAGLLANVVSFRLLADGGEGEPERQGAYLEVLSDMLGSVAVIGAVAVGHGAGPNAAASGRSRTVR